MPSKRYPKLIKHLPLVLVVLIRELVGRIDRGKNCLVVCVGATGSGKSWAMVSLMYWIFVYMEGREPTIEEMRTHWFFRAGEFLKKLNEPNLKRKQRFLWDEVGVDLGHKSHATIKNRAIGWLVQTFRNQQSIVLFTVPTMAFIDATVRKMLHYQIEVRQIIKKRNLCVVKPLKLQYNVRMDKLYYHNITRLATDGSDLIEEIDLAVIPKPPKEIVKVYEEDKNAFTSQLNKDIQKIIDEVDNKQQNNKEVKLKRPLTERQNKILNLLEGGVNQTKKIAEILKCKAPIISANFKWMKQKGIDIAKYKAQVEFKRFNPQF